MNNDLISRSKVIEELNYLKHIGYDNSGVMKLQNMEIQRCISVIEDVPAVEKRPQGEWKYHKAEGNFLPTMECSECHASDLLGGLTRKEYKAVNKFCFNCGAKMKGGADMRGEDK